MNKASKNIKQSKIEIILLRHGKPEVELSGNATAVTLKDIALDYKNSGVSEIGQQPETHLRLLLNQSYYSICSDLKRSQDSANLLGFSNIDLTDPIFNESDIPLFNGNFILLKKIKLPLLSWLIILRILWLFGFKQNGESFNLAKKRAKMAADKLISLAYEHEKVVLVGHGLFNRLIANQLRSKDWRGPRSPGKKFWQYGVYYLSDDI